MKRFALCLLTLALAGCEPTITSKVLHDGVIVARCGSTLVYRYQDELYGFNGNQRPPLVSRVETVEAICHKITDLPTIHFKLEK